MKVNDIITEVSLGTYHKKASMSKAMAQMNKGFGYPGDHDTVINKRTRGLARAKSRSDKAMATQAAKNRDAHIAGIVANADSLKQKLAALEKQFDPDYDYSDDYSFWNKQRGIKAEIDNIKRMLASAGINESNMSEIDIEYQDYKKLPPVAFLSRYGMSKEAWFAKYKNILPRK